MSTIIDRDWTKQEKFGKDLQDFENSMRTLSRTMRSHIDEARGSIQGENAVDAMNQIIQMLDTIDSVLPGIEEFGARQITLAHHIRDAEALKIKRR